MDDTDSNWLELMKNSLSEAWWKKANGETLSHAKKAIDNLTVSEDGRGGQYVAWREDAEVEKLPSHLQDWYRDPRMEGVCNHMTKAHMESDVYRYLFAASHLKAGRDKLKLDHFPAALLPDHKNVTNKSKAGEKGGDDFVDRFSVVHPDTPARTIVSHIAKDGHYYIHPDAKQARSLTVREAARVQTFPDNFYFPGNRTEQYAQVGNAVPPYLAWQIAALVDDLLHRAGR
jgi:DNA (cytosine-5)-methyltransferase 1